MRERREDCPIFLEDSVGGALLLISASKPDVQILTVEYRSRSESTAAMTYIVVIVLQLGLQL